MVGLSCFAAAAAVKPLPGRHALAVFPAHEGGGLEILNAGFALPWFELRHTTSCWKS